MLEETFVMKKKILRSSSLFHLHPFCTDCHYVLDQVWSRKPKKSPKDPSSRSDTKRYSFVFSGLEGPNLELLTPHHSFWIPPEGTPARVTLGVTSLLTLTTQVEQSDSLLTLSCSLSRVCRPSRPSPRSPIPRPSMSGSPPALSLSFSGLHFWPENNIHS